MKLLILVLSLFMLNDLKANELQGCNTTIVAGLSKDNFYSSAKANIGKLKKHSLGGYASEAYLELYLGTAATVADAVNVHKNKGKTNYDYLKIKEAIRNYNGSYMRDSIYSDLYDQYAKTCANRLSELALMKLVTSYDCDNTTCELQDWINGVGQEAKSFYEKVDKMFIRSKVRFMVEGYDKIYCLVSAKDIIKAFTGVVVKFEPSIITPIKKLTEGRYGGTVDGTKLSELSRPSEADLEKYSTKRVYNASDSKIYLRDGTEINLPIKFEITINEYKVIEKETGYNKVIFDLENYGEKSSFQTLSKTSQYGCMFLFRTKERKKLTDPWSWSIALATIPLTGTEYLDKTKTCTDFISKIGGYTPGSIPSIRYYTRPMREVDNSKTITSANTQLCRKK